MRHPRIAVVGSGANGSIVAADLIAAGHDVTLIEQWPEHVETMRSDGLVVTCRGTSTRTAVRVLHLCEVATLTERFDLVFMLLKAYDTRWGAELISSVLTDDAIVLGLQNGMSIDDLQDVLGPARALGGVIEVGSNMYEPGRVNRDTPRDRSWFAVGGIDSRAQARATEVAAVLGAAGTVAVSDDIRADKWMKLILNAAELAPSALLGASIAEAAQIPQMRDLMLEAGREAIAAAAVAGHRLRPIMGMETVDPDDPEGFLTEVFDLLLNHFALPTTRSTVHQDWVKGRRSEVDSINGLVVDTLARVGEAAPVNAAVVTLAHRIENGSCTPSLEVLETFAELANAGRA